MIGFYPTGDLGALDAEGDLWYHGRRDDMFKVKGATVYPGEVEAALRVIEGVRQAHVRNVAGTVSGDVDAVGALAVSDRTLDDLVAAARQRLSAFKGAARWIITDSTDDVSMTPTAKIDKTAVQKNLLEHTREETLR